MATAVEVILQGRHWEIVAVARANRNQVADFVVALPIPSQKKIVRMLRMIADAEAGPFMFRNDQKMRRLGDEIYELKSDQVRLLFFIDRPRRVVVASGFLKKSQRTPRSEIERAMSVRALYYREAP
ncbi:MAG: type II toxin-antitoxin system RelE/ParE family toxin [Chloroflexi bacterium]|nr:type II toxin-antitoxin system RelE/ParE family toxin [Chloroflexota bacterium]